MKKTLLLSALSLSLYSSAQMTQSNEPVIGTLNSMHVCDSFATNYDGVTGAGVTWDYSELSGYDFQLDVQAVDPTTTTYASDFSSSTYAVKVGNSLTTYYSSTATERLSQGFVFSEASLGDVIATFSGNEELVVNYPFALSNSLTDDFSGNLGYLGGLSTTADGTGYAQIDGSGTLEIMGTTLSNVIRYKLVDTSWATITLPFPLGDMEFIRRQYEYYDYTVSNLPVLIHSTITVQNVGSTNPISEQSLVLSYYAPTTFVGLDENANDQFTVYPNPTNDEIRINGTFSDGASVEILDQTGRVVVQSSLTQGQVISLASLTDGIYLVRIADQGQSTTTSIVKK